MRNLVDSSTLKLNATLQTEMKLANQMAPETIYRPPLSDLQLLALITCVCSCQSVCCFSENKSRHEKAPF